MKFETLKRLLADEVKYYRLLQHYEYALEGENLEAHRRAISKRIRATRRKYRRLIR